MLSAGAEAQAYHDEKERLVDGTAHTLRSGELRLGLYSFDVGTLPVLTLGTDTLPWIASAFVGGPVLNAHVKVQLLRTAPLTLSASAATYYARIGERVTQSEPGGSILVVPVSLFASADLSRRLSIHGEGTYAHVDGTSTLDFPVAGGRTVLVASAVQLGVMTELRVSRVTAFTLRYRHQLYASPAAFRSSGSLPTGERISVEGNVVANDPVALSAIAGVAFSGKHMNLRLGAGYGTVFLPSLGFSLPFRTVIPEVDFYVRF